MSALTVMLRVWKPSSSDTHCNHTLFMHRSVCSSSALTFRPGLFMAATDFSLRVSWLRRDICGSQRQPTLQYEHSVALCCTVRQLTPLGKTSLSHPCAWHGTCFLRAESLCKQRSLDASLPSGITPFASIDADGYTTVSNALHFFDAFRNGDYSELAVWSGIRDIIIRLLVLRCPRQ